MIARPLPSREYIAARKHGYGTSARIRWLYVCGHSLEEIARNLDLRGGVADVRRTILRPVRA